MWGYLALALAAALPTINYLFSDKFFALAAVLFGLIKVIIFVNE